MKGGAVKLFGKIFNRPHQGNRRPASDYIVATPSELDETLRSNPQDAAGYNNRGNARFLTGDLFGAIDDYSEAIRSTRNLPPTTIIEASSVPR